jgi:hypothetical protein
MKAKISNFLQSDVFILLVALLMGFLCHFFVTTEILASDDKERYTKSLYSSVFDFEPLIGRKLQSLERENEKNFKLSALLESTLNILMRDVCQVLQSVTLPTTLKVLENGFEMIKKKKN